VDHTCENDVWTISKIEEGGHALTTRLANKNAGGGMNWIMCLRLGLQIGYLTEVL